MKYTEARTIISSGDLLAWSGNSLFSKAIKWFTGSPYSHVGIAWKANDRLFVIESMDFIGVRIFPCSRLLPFYWAKTNACWQLMKEEAFRLIGAKYSVIGCVKAGLGIKTRDDNYYQCAEFAQHLLSDCAKINLSETCETPAKLVQAFENIGDKAVFIER